MRGMEPSMSKEVRAKARSASRSRRETSAQTRGELRGRVGHLASGGRSFSAAKPKGKGGERGIESVRFTDETGCGGWVK